MLRCKKIPNLPLIYINSTLRAPLIKVMKMFFNAVTALLMHSFVPGAVGCSETSRGQRNRPRACRHPLWCIIVYRALSIISTSESMALQHRSDSMPCNTRGGMKGGTQSGEQKVWHGAKGREGGKRRWELRNVRYRVLTVSAALCCFVSLLLPSASYAGDTGLTALQFPPIHLLNNAPHTLMRKLPICC